MTDNLFAGTRDPQATPAAPAPAAADTQTPPGRVRAVSPAGILAVVPPLLGFDPGPSFVVLGTEPPRSRVQVTLRFNLPDPGDRRRAAEIARDAVSVLSAQGIATAVAVGYGSEQAVSPVVAALREHASRAQITLTELLRAQDQRYWSYVCTSPACCPAEGTPFDIAGHPAARALALAGQPVLASREELRATLAAADGEAAEAMRRAVGRAHRQIAVCVARGSRPDHRIARRRVTAVLGRLAVAEAISRCRAGEPVGTELAAWLTVALREVRVRDDAWARMLPEHQGAHRRLWTDLTRLARPGYVAAPASLLAFVAWQSGSGALANIALDRALADNPHYSMAKLLRQVLDSGAPPSMARLPMTPEEVAASYDAAEAAEANEAADDAAEAR
jgi:hypothetical protein